MSSPPRHIDSYAPVLSALRREGVDPEAVLRELGVDPAAPVTRSAQPAPRTALGLLARAVELRGEGFAARAASTLRLEELGVLGLACLSAPTVGDALERALRYRRLVYEDDDYALELGEDFVSLVRRPLPAAWARGNRTGARALVELGLIEHLVALREVAGARLGSRIELRLRHPPPPDGGAELRSVTGVRVRFGAPRDELRMPRALLERPTRHGHAALAAFFDELARERLGASAKSDSSATRVRRHLMRELRGGSPTARSTARALGVSDRTLTRRLAAEGTSFLELLDEVRNEVALQLLGRRDVSLAEIAFLLGFSEPRAFHRAFRRWNGRTPGAVRADGPQRMAHVARKVATPSTR